jgi:hypothetical protein
VAYTSSLFDKAALIPGESKPKLTIVSKNWPGEADKVPGGAKKKEMEDKAAKKPTVLGRANFSVWQ